MRSCFKSLVKFYRLFLSPFMGGQCRFYPTCSAYALEALDRLPWPQALWKIVKRVCSCHPFHLKYVGGVDLLKIEEKNMSHETKRPNGPLRRRLHRALPVEGAT